MQETANAESTQQEGPRISTQAKNEQTWEEKVANAFEELKADKRGLSSDDAAVS
jgi:hypothetical protein